MLQRLRSKPGVYPVLASIVVPVLIFSLATWIGLQDGNADVGLGFFEACAQVIPVLLLALTVPLVSPFERLAQDLREVEAEYDDHERGLLRERDDLTASKLGRVLGLVPPTRRRRRLALARLDEAISATAKARDEAERVGERVRQLRRNAIALLVMSWIVGGVAEGSALVALAIGRASPVLLYLTSVGLVNLLLLVGSALILWVQVGRS